ncbi:MAG: hypothetical protein HGA54_00655 [Actinobacteria bacterium]|nr:hypothetical protein [Actinomycetota bacterium]
MVVITHSMSVVEKICSKVAVIDDAHILEQGSVTDVFAHPEHEVTKQLLGQVRWDA